MNNPLVSVIVNCFNGEKYLKECIQSIINQTYTNLEIIFWNNNSTDKSQKIISEFSDKRIKVFESSEKLNLGESRNKAIQKSSGELITFLDVDDWYLPEKLSLQVKVFEENNDVGLVFTNYFNLNDNNKKKKISNCEILNDNISQHLLDNYNIGILTVMIKKDLLLKNQFKLDYNFIEDFDLIFRLSFKTKFYFIELPTSYYRYHEENLSKVKLEKFIEEFKMWIDLNRNKLKNKFDLKNLETKVKLMQIKNDILKGDKFKAFLKIKDFKFHNNYSKRFKLFIALFLPTFLLKKILKQVI